MAQSDGQANTFSVFIDFASKFLIPFVMAFVAWQHTEMNKLEDRVYTLQRDAVTEQKLSDVEKRLTTYMDVRISDVAMKQDMTNKYLELLLQTIKDQPRK